MPTVATLASLDDVKRILRIALDDDNPARDAQLEQALDAIEAWATRSLQPIALEGPQVETYHDVYEDATLLLPAACATVNAVRVFEYPSSAGVPLSSVELGLGHGYEVTVNKRLLLRPTLLVSPFEGATAQRQLRCYARVEVGYTAADGVPSDVRDGIAYLAAGYWRTGPQMLANLNSERIGDYAYSVSGGGSGQDMEPRYVSQAMFFLTPYLNRKKVAVT